MTSIFVTCVDCEKTNLEYFYQCRCCDKFVCVQCAKVNFINQLCEKCTDLIGENNPNLNMSYYPD